MTVNKPMDVLIKTLSERTPKKTLIEARSVDVFYGKFQALKNINIETENEVCRLLR